MHARDKHMGMLVSVAHAMWQAYLVLALRGP